MKQKITRVHPAMLAQNYRMVHVIKMWNLDIWFRGITVWRLCGAAGL